MHITRAQLERWIALLRERGRKAPLDSTAVFEVLENEVGADLSPSLPSSASIAPDLDDEALADALAQDMVEALDDDAAGAVWDVGIGETKGPPPEGSDLDAAIRSWTLDMLTRINGMDASATIPLRHAIDSLERILQGRPRGTPQE